MVLFACCAIFVAHTVHHTAITRNFGGLCMRVNGHVVQALKFVNQYSIGLQLIGKFNDRYVSHNACQINGGLNARIAAANDGRALALEQRTIAMRAVSDTFIFVFLLARYIDIAPARTGRQNHGAGIQHATVFHLHLNQTA